VKFSEKQRLAYRTSTKRYNVLSGAMSSGKTHLCNIIFPSFILGTYGTPPPDKDFIIVGKTQGTVRQNIINPMLEIFGALVELKREDGLTYLCFANGRRAWCTGADNEKAYTKILGKVFAGAYIDEVVELDKKAVNQVMGRVMDGGRVYFTTNPSSPYHWFYKDMVEKAESDEQINYIPFGLLDNPTLTELQIKELNTRYTGLFHKRYIQGIWTAAEGVIYDMFDPEIHVKPYLGGAILENNCFLDYGIGNPFVVMNIVKSEGGIWAMSEYGYDSKEAGKQKTDDEYIQDILNYYIANKLSMKTPLICDPSITYRFRSALTKAGFVVKFANNSVLSGIGEVASLLSQDRFHLVDGKCKGAELEFSSYCWDLQAQKKGEDKPLKVNDHRMDVIRYAVNHYMNKPRRARIGGSAI